MATIVSLVALPLAVFAQGAYSSGAQTYPPLAGTEQMIPGAPPLGQTLVPEGAFAVQLAQALNLGQVQDEAQAETLLSSVGIEPNNGWVGSYPVTPDIVAEIQSSVGAAADANRLLMGRDEAQRTVGTVLAGFGLAIEPGGAETRALAGGQVSPPPPEVVNNYYYQYGPPVVTYYTPPPDYAYLYAWVPDPFWFGGFFFNGFFILHDFHRHIHFHDRVFVVSNHFVEPRTHRLFVVDPARRHFESHAFRGFDSRREFHSPGVQHSAGRIMAHNRDFTPHGAASIPQRSFGGGFHEGGGFHQSGVFRQGGQHNAGAIMAHNRAITPHGAASMPQRSFGRGFHEGGGFHQGGGFRQGAGPSGGFHGGGFGGGHGGGGGRHR